MTDSMRLKQFNFNLERICTFYADAPRIVMESHSFIEFFHDYCKLMDWYGCGNSSHSFAYFDPELFDSMLTEYVFDKPDPTIYTRPPLHSRSVQFDIDGYKFSVIEHKALRRFLKY